MRYDKMTTFSALPVGTRFQDTLGKIFKSQDILVKTGTNTYKDILGEATMLPEWPVYPVEDDK